MSAMKNFEGMGRGELATIVTRDSTKYSYANIWQKTLVCVPT